MEFLEPISYGGVDYDIPLLSKTGFDTTPTPLTSAVYESTNPIYRSFNRIWDRAEFKIPRRPTHVAYLDEYAYDFATFDNVRVLDMPVKMAGANTYFFPDELNYFLDVAQEAINHEHTVNPRAIDYYAYLTIDQQELHTGQFHRPPGCHVEGLQTARLDAKFRNDHHYHMVNEVPTEFFPHEFSFDDYGSADYNLYRLMDTLAKPDLIWKPREMQMILTDCYTVRREPVIPSYTVRTFFRLTYSVRIYDRLGNTWNPMFGEAWTYYQRPTPYGLIDPTTIIYP